MLSVDFLIVDRIPCGRFHANISRIPNIGETVSLAFKGSVEWQMIQELKSITCTEHQEYTLHVFLEKIYLIPKKYSISWTN